MGSALKEKMLSTGSLSLFPEHCELDYELRRFQPAPDNWRIWAFVANFTFQPAPVPSDAILRKTLAFRTGDPYFLQSIAVQGTWVSTANEDAGSDLMLSLYLGSKRRPLQSQPVLFSAIRGGGLNAAERTTWGLPLFEFPAYIHGAQPILVDVENLRPVPVGESLLATVHLRGIRRYTR
jgi:hypothetical protein